jgi:cyclohexyl-isocyanide hydratase
MDRRTLGRYLGSAAALATAQHALGARALAQSESATPEPTATVGMLLYPGLTTLDLVGPMDVLAWLPGRTTQLLWKNRDTVVSETGIPMQPTATFAEAPDELEILFVPGSLTGLEAVLRDADILDFVATRGERATYVTSVCTGALVLGAAGLLHGYRATSHWSVRDLLPLVGAEPVAERVVEDGNRITGGGVTAGIDFGLTWVARLAGDDLAQGVQLGYEYDPHPPFQSGTPDQAEPAVVAQMTGMFDPFLAAIRDALLRSPGHIAG